MSADMEGDFRTPYRVQARDMDHFAEMVDKRDVYVAKALAEAIMESPDPEKPEGVTVEFPNGNYAVIDFEDGQAAELRGSLADSLPYFEKQEWYELCARVKEFLARPVEKPAKTEKRSGTGRKNPNQAKQ